MVDQSQYQLAKVSCPGSHFSTPGFPLLHRAELPWALSFFISFLSVSLSCVAFSEGVRKEEFVGNLSKGKRVKRAGWGSGGTVLTS